MVSKGMAGRKIGNCLFILLDRKPSINMFYYSVSIVFHYCLIDLINTPTYIKMTGFLKIHVLYFSFSLMFDYRA